MSHMSKARKIHFCTDIWSKKGLTASFIGITAHFFSEHKRHNVTLAVKRMPSPHSAEEVLKIVLQTFEDWNIPNYKIGSIITDNGSNMVKAFKLLQQVNPDAANEDNECDYVNEPSTMMSDSDIPDSVVTTQSEDSEEEEEGEDLEEGDQPDIEEEARDFDETEYEHDIIFAGYKRLSCFAHSLQLVSKFNECNVLFRRTV